MSRSTPYWFKGFNHKMQAYYDWKDSLEDERGLSFGTDYNVLFQLASDSPGEDAAGGGVVRIYGSWTLSGRGSADSGALVFKLENRHRLGTDIAPQQLAGELGYAGLTAITYSDAGSLLSNFYWQQSFMQNRLGLVAGIVDVTDYVDVYGLGNPWTDFSNLAFSTSPTIPAPNQGSGTAVRWRFNDNYYLLAGFADSNADPSKPGDSINNFFSDHELFTHLEIGWISGWDQRYSDNVHATFWHQEEREEAGVESGWGVALSYSSKVDNRWLPFLRAGYSDGGGALLDRSVSAGLGYFPGSRQGDTLGFGVSWGRPSEVIYGKASDEQFTMEIFYRVQLFPHLSITPDLQLLLDPVNNTGEDRIWVVGIRARVAL